MNNILNSRTKSISIVAICLLFFIILFSLNFILSDKGLSTNLLKRNQVPSFENLLGTDTLGRDMLTRTVKGLFVSFQIGLAAAAASAVMSLILGIAAATFGKKVDMVITGLIDLFMSVPHIVLLILVSFALGGGFKGIIIAVAVSHWPRLARIIRAEILQLKNSHYVQLSYKFGRSKFWVIKNHMAGHVLSQFLVGLILMFPHAIMHSAGLSFLGFGLTPHNPCIGILLSESMMHLATGYWWLAIFPGLALVLMVLGFDAIGKNLSKILNPKTREE
jgi:peptide/nickel transport system permease protein